MMFFVITRQPQKFFAMLLHPDPFPNRISLGAVKHITVQKFIFLLVGRKRETRKGIRDTVSRKRVVP